MTYECVQPLVMAVLCKCEFAIGGWKWTVPKVCRTEAEAVSYRDFLILKKFEAITVNMEPVPL